MSIPIHQVDAFTDRPFAGNPAAVCVLEEPREETWMQQVAAEMNLSETAFVEPRGDGFGLRWFTPLREVELCGHATLAAAHVLWETGRLSPRDPARFHTRFSGELGAARRGEWIELDFPSRPPDEIAPDPDLLDALGADPEWVGRAGDNVLVELADEDAVRALRPDFRRLAPLDAGVIATARGSDCDFVSRYFAPAWGVDEDPVTGSAHCCSGPYWQRKLGRDEMLARQVSRRGGVLRVRPRGGRTRLAGQAVTVLRGTLTDPAVTPGPAAPSPSGSAS